jgi:hypothetical protein
MRVSVTYVRLALKAAASKRKAIERGRCPISDMLMNRPKRLALPAPAEKPLVELWDTAPESERVRILNAHAGEMMAWLDSITAPTQSA